MRNALLASALLLLCGALPLGAAPGDTRTFIGEMLHGVGATRVDCPAEVVAVVSSHDMRAVCARFDGDFGQFESRWKEHLERYALVGRSDGTGLLPPARPRTAWEHRDGIYERVYSVGAGAVGVRFMRGDVVAVY